MGNKRKQKINIIIEHGESLNELENKAREELSLISFYKKMRLLIILFVDLSIIVPCYIYEAVNMHSFLGVAIVLYTCVSLNMFADSKLWKYCESIIDKNGLLIENLKSVSNKAIELATDNILKTETEKLGGTCDIAYFLGKEKNCYMYSVITSADDEKVNSTCVSKLSDNTPVFYTKLEMEEDAKDGGMIEG